MAILFIGAAPARADFVGNLQLVPAGCESAGECRLGADFGFVDAAGLGWQTHKVFYEALRASGVSESLAGIMYYAVIMGGPK
ncbi:hypothetical protein AB4Z10_13415 [Bosea sp. RAF48]|uniref:hypothetical protein n=1 Tax=Bosea sp. RAF48 TaxID=3237480 RepID=UPI003F8F599B